MFKSPDAGERLRKAIEQRSVVSKQASTSEDLPLSRECKRALIAAAALADYYRHRTIEPLHLLGGLLTDPNTLAAELLAAEGVTLAGVRPTLQQLSAATADTPAHQVAGELPERRARELHLIDASTGHVI